MIVSWNQQTIAFVSAVLYVLSGCSQPLMMTIATDAGLADPVAQVYMLFYYLGPSFMIIPLFFESNGNNGSNGDDESSPSNNNNNTPNPSSNWPSRRGTLKAIGIALFDIISTSMNYTGASLAGPTIFAIIYSSVTVWTAVFSQLFLGRKMNGWQWMGVCVVFGGLTLTATDSIAFGRDSDDESMDVVKGLILILFGSAMHALTYILCEAIMTVGDEKLSVSQTCGIQASTACLFFFVWQLVYTFPKRDQVLLEPMQEAGTTIWIAVGMLSAFGIANLIHAVTFYETILNYPGGATSAGVFKGLQAVLVFVVTHVAFCGRTGGEEMCFSTAKFVSLITVVGGVVAYGVATHYYDEEHGSAATTNSDRNKKKKLGYEIIQDAVSSSIEIEPLAS